MVFDYGVAAFHNYHSKTFYFDFNTVPNVYTDSTNTDSTCDDIDSDFNTILHSSDFDLDSNTSNTTNTTNTTNVNITINVSVNATINVRADCNTNCSSTSDYNSNPLDDSDYIHSDSSY